MRSHFCSGFGERNGSSVADNSRWCLIRDWQWLYTEEMYLLICLRVWGELLEVVGFLAEWLESPGLPLQIQARTQDTQAHLLAFKWAWSLGYGGCLNHQRWDWTEGQEISGCRVLCCPFWLKMARQSCWQPVQGCCQGFFRRTFRLSLSGSSRAGASYYFPDNYIHLQNSETMAWKGHSAAGEEEGVKTDTSKGHAQVQ